MDNGKDVDEFRSILASYGYKELTPLQKSAFRLICKGANVLIIAPTGYGKTEAALFPIMFSLYKKVKSSVEVKGIQALYVTPLRALNRDIFRRMERLASDLGLIIKIRHGDTSQHERRKISLKPPHILITTPETFQFLLVGKRIREALKNVKWVIVDELHELMSSKRGLQLVLSLERLRQITYRNYQRIALSATIGSPELAARYISGGSKVEVLEASGKKKYKVDVLYVNPLKEDEELASQVGMYPEVIARLRTIKKVVETHNGTIIFTNTRDTAELLSSRLKLMYGVEVYVHHGSLSKEERVSVENKFKNHEVRAVVATSSLELGIDIGHVDFVVQYMSPRQVTRLVQRVGRSGHFMDRTSAGAIIAFDLDDYLESLVIARRALNGDLEKSEFEECALDVLAHQIVGLTLEYGSLDIKRIYSIMAKAYPYRNLSLSTLRRLLNFMEKIKLIKTEDDIVRIGSRGLSYYFENASTIPDVPSYKVIDLVERRNVGKLDADFVASSLAEDSTFILGGKPWKVIQVEPEKEEVYVRRTKLELGEPPIWTGEDLPVPFKVAREVGALRRRIAEASGNVALLSEVMKEYGISNDSLNYVLRYIEEQAEKAGAIPSDRLILIEISGKHAVINTCVGSKGNETLGMIISYLLNSLYGASSIYRADPYRIALKASTFLSEEIFANIFSKLEEAINNIGDVVKRTNIYKLKFIQVARRLGVIEKGAEKKISQNIIKILQGTPVDEETLKEIISTRLDLKAVRWFVENLRSNKIRIVYRYSSLEEFSPMSASIYNRYAKLGILQEVPPVSVIVNVVKRRLENTRIRLFCLHCGEWYSEYRVKDVPENVSCLRCGSRALAVTSPRDEEVLSLVKRWKRGSKLSLDEEKKVKYLQQSAILFMSYGKKALMAIAGHGIGPNTAIRVLRASNDERELIVNILKAENMYAKTRQYWD